MYAIETQRHQVRKQPKWQGARYTYHDLVILLIISLAAFWQRFITMGLIDHGVSSDEFYYAVNALGIENILRGSSLVQMKDVYVMHPLVSYPVGVLGLLVDMDTLLMGRYLQLSFNALTIPLTYILTRDIGFSRWISIGAAMSLSIFRGYWEDASHFWPDSQFALLLIASCMLFTRTFRKGGAGHWHVLASAGVLMMATLTREHAPVILVIPFGYLLSIKILAGNLKLGKGLRIVFAHTGAILVAYLLMTTGLFFPRSDNLAVALRIAPTEGPDIIMQRTKALQETPSFFVSSLTNLRFDFERLNYGLGEGIGSIFLIFGTVGLMASIAIIYSRYSVETNALVAPVRGLIRTSGTIVLCLASCLLASVVLESLSVPFPRLLAIGGLYIFFQHLVRQRLWQSGNHPIILHGEHSKPVSGSELTFYGLVIVAVSFVHMSFDPQISSNARFYFPIFPIIAMFGTYGMVSIAEIGVLALFALLYSTSILSASLNSQVVLPMHKVILGLVALLHYMYLHVLKSKDELLSVWKPYALPTLMFLIILATPFSNLVRYSYQSAAYMGYPDDPYYARVHAGIRWRLLNEIKPWLVKNVDTEDRILSNQAHYIAWAAGTGLGGLYNSMYLPQEPHDVSLFFLTNPLDTLDVDYIVQLNPYLHEWADPQQYEAWVNVYNALAARGDLVEVYQQESTQGKLESYIFKKIEL